MNVAHHQKLDSVQNEAHQREQALSREKEELRKQKDAEIRQLTQEKETQRETYERRILELENTIKCKYRVYV